MNPLSDSNLPSFLKLSRKAADKVVEHSKKGSFACIIGHSDADGISASSIIALALYRESIPFKLLRTWKMFDEDLLQEAVNHDADLYIFTDLGSGYIDIMNRRLSKKDVIIVDHHQPSGRPLPNIIHVNPHLVGYDGAYEISAAGVAYFIAKLLRKQNVDLAHLAVIGSLGDSQDENEERKLIKLNELIVQDAISSNYLHTRRGLIFYRRETLPIFKAIARTVDPFIVGLTGKEGECSAFLQNLGIKLVNGGKLRTISSLTEEEERTLCSGLANYLISKGFSSEISKLIGTIYTLIREPKGTPLRDAREFSSLINACGRMGEPGLGISICMGCRGGDLEEALHVMEEYRRTLRKCIDWLMEFDKVKEGRNFYIINGEGVINDRIIGVIAGIIARIVKKPKPVIAFTPMEKNLTKFSIRMRKSQVDKELNLGFIFMEAARKVGGIGGGHRTAAGAQIPEGKEKDFLREVEYYFD